MTMDGIVSIIGFFMSRQFFRNPYLTKKSKEHPNAVLQKSKQGVIITIARQHGSSGKEIGRLVAEKLGIPFYYGRIMRWNSEARRRVGRLSLKNTKD